MTCVFLNGTFLDPADPQTPALVSAFDAGLTHAVGLFETMTAGVISASSDADPEPWVYRLSDHLRRLAASAAELGLTSSLNTEALAQAVLATVRRANLPRARVRLAITGGDLNLLAARAPDDAPRSHDPTILISAQPATPYPDAMFDRGVAVTVAASRANPFNPLEAHKTLNYWWRLRELQLAARAGAAEAIVADVTNHLVGGCVSNLFLVKNDTLITPHARTDDADEDPTRRRPTATLPGITRRAILDIAAERGIPAERRPVTINDLLEADEAFLTNASWGVLPVVAVEARPIGTPPPPSGQTGDNTATTPPPVGSLTRSLRADYLGALAAWADDHHAAERALTPDNDDDGPGVEERWLDPSAQNLASELDAPPDGDPSLN